MKTQSTITVLLSAVVGSGMVGCASQPVSTSEADVSDEIYAERYTEQGSGEHPLVIKRDEGIVGSACDHLVYVSGQKVAGLGAGEKVTVYLKEGTHIIGAKTAAVCTGSSAEAQVEVTEGTNATYRIATDQNGGLDLEPTAF